jgi:alpha-tubulin suppressor-like RCC1 family protein
LGFDPEIDVNNYPDPYDVKFAAQDRPVWVSGLEVTKIVGSWWFCLGLRDDGTVSSWGTPRDYVQQGRPIRGLTNVVDIGSGNDHGIALRSDGTVWVWGLNPLDYPSVAAPPLKVFTGAAAVAAGGAVMELFNPEILDKPDFDFDLVLTEDGFVWSLGSNHNGQLGRWQGNCRVPGQVPGLSAVRCIAAGPRTSVAAKVDGTIYEWGTRLGDAPMRVGAVPGVEEVSAGTEHALARTNAGEVWAWGRGAEGQLGDGTGLDRNVPVKVVGLPQIVGVSAGWNHSLACDAAGGVWAWGSGQGGAIGDGAMVNRLSPVAVPLPKSETTGELQTARPTLANGVCAVGSSSFALARAPFPA